MPTNLEKTLETHSGLAARFLDIFIIANLAFLALDVFIAHSVNAFDHSAEWVPFYFSLGAPWATRIYRIYKKKTMETLVPSRHWMECSICIGIAGMLFHLNSHFFSDLTLKNLVYTAPFVAPLAFTGIGLLLLMNGMIHDADLEWAHWVVFMAGCGWCGNFILSVFDHAQNGFFNPTEWLPVFTSAVAIGCLATLFFVVRTNPFSLNSVWLY